MQRKLVPFKPEVAGDSCSGRSEPDAAGSDPTLDPVELAAAEWLVRHDRGLTADQEDEWVRWLQADVRHARMHARLLETWGRLERVPAEWFPLRSRARPRLAWLALSAAAAVLAVTSYVAFHNPSRSRAADPLFRAATGAGGFTTMDMPDGSVVELNADSTVEGNFMPTERRLHLVRGEAYFAVAKDAARPLVVRVGTVDIRAIGTAFNVRLKPAAVEVLVTEGKVRVGNSASGQSLIANVLSQADPGAPEHDIPPTESLLIAGHRVVIPFLADGVSSIPIPAAAVEPAEIQRELAWQSRTLEFGDETLASVVREFNRYNRHKLDISDPRLARKRFGGKFPAHDYESFVSFLEAHFGVVVQRQGDQTTLRLAQ